MAKSSKNNKSTSTITELEHDKKSNFKKYYYFFGILTFVLFANTLGHGYNMDDSMVTNFHPLTSKGLSAIGEIFTSPYYSDDMGYAYGYRPMVHLSFALEHELFGQSPGAGHFINVLLFSLCVLMYFKLLLSWFGTKNSIFIAIATLLFAVHPIHTEVVNSLKNRDELLAFLFIIWSGIIVNRYISKQKIMSLIGLIILVIAAMLSKKSSYPLAVLIPMILLLLNKLNLKQLIVISTCMIIPAAIIGSDFELKRMLLMIILPVFLIAIVWIITSKEDLNDDDSTIYSKKELIFAIIGFLCTFGFYYWSQSFIALIASLGFLSWVFKVNGKAGIILLIIPLSAISHTFLGIDSKQLLLFFTVIYAFHLKHKKESIYFWLPILTIGCIFYILYFPHHFGVVYMLTVIVLGFLTYKNIQIAFILGVTLLITYSFMTNSFPIHILFYILFLVIKFMTDKDRLSYKNLLYFPLIIVLFTYSAATIGTLSNSIHNQEISEENIGSVNNLGNTSNLTKTELGSKSIKEGRQLQFVENTLVAKHTEAEKIATGFFTLGQYLKLHIYPVELSFYYGFSKIKTVNFSNPFVWLSILLHAALLIMGLFTFKKRPLITVGVLWYFASILLFSNWVELVAGMVGERLAFTASAGFAIFIAGVVAWINPDMSFKKLGITGIIIISLIVLFAGRTLLRNNDWKDTYTLMNHDIKHLEESAQAQNLYAMTLMQLSNPATQKNPTTALLYQNEAIQHFEKALEIAPDYFNVYVNLGRAAMITKNHDKAINAFNNAIKIEPNYFAPYNHLLEIYQIQKDQKMYAKTAKQLFDVVKEPRTFILHAMGEFQLGNREKSKKILEEGLIAYPNDEAIMQNLNSLK